MSTSSTILAAFIVALSAGSLAAADVAPVIRDTTKHTDAGPKPQDTALKPGNQPKHMSRYMEGREVFNEKGDQVGTIKSIVLDGTQRRISYAAVSCTGTGKLVAVPWAAFTRKIDDTEKMCIYGQESALKDSPGFSTDAWPSEPDSAFAKSDDSKSEANMRGAKAKHEKNKEVSDKTGPSKDGIVWTRRASDLIGAKVVNAQNEDIGVIKDIVFNPRTGVVHYGVLSYGGVLGKGDKLFAVPMAAIGSKPDDKVVVVDMTKEFLDGHTGFDKEAWPHWNDQDVTFQQNDFYRVVGLTKAPAK